MSEVATILLQKEREFVRQHLKNPADADKLTDEEIDRKFDELVAELSAKYKNVEA